MEPRKNLLITFGEWWESRSVNSSEKASRSIQLNRVLRWLVPNGGTLLMVIVLILTQQVWAKPFQSTNDTPGPSATTVNYQGRLADNAGNPLDGTYGMSFALYDAVTDGSLIWGPEEHTAVPVSEGLFSVGLGSKTSGGIPTSAWNGDRYLEITVGGETLSPRELIRSVPIAGMALTVPDGAINNSHLALTRYTIDGIQDHLVLNTEEQILGETTINIPYAATYLAFVTIDANGHGGRSIFYLRDENDNSYGFGNHTSDNVMTTSNTLFFELPAGQHTLKLTARIGSGDVGQEVRSGTKVIIVPIAQTP